MSSKQNKTNKVWLAIIAGILIVFLLIWLTVAMFTGDTDVAAMLPMVGLH